MRVHNFSGRILQLEPFYNGTRQAFIDVIITRQSGGLLAPLEQYTRRGECNRNYAIISWQLSVIGSYRPTCNKLGSSSAEPCKLDFSGRILQLEAFYNGTRQAFIDVIITRQSGGLLAPLEQYTRRGECNRNYAIISWQLSVIGSYRPTCNKLGSSSAEPCKFDFSGRILQLGPFYNGTRQAFIDAIITKQFGGLLAPLEWYTRRYRQLRNNTQEDIGSYTLWHKQ